MTASQRRAVLYLHRLAITNPTGVHRHALELARALTRRGADVGVELWSGREDPPPHEAGLDLRQPRVNRRLLHASWTAVQRPAFDRLTGPVDVVHQTSPAFPLPSHAPLVVTIHDLMPHHHPEWYPREQRVPFLRAVTHAAKHAAVITTGSTVVARDVESVLGVSRDRIRVVHYGIGASFYDRIDESVVHSVCSDLDLTPGRYAVTVGEVSPRKNLPVLIEALRVTEHPLVLAVVGSTGTYGDDMRALAAAAGVADRVRFTGRVSDEVLRALVQGARVLAHPATYEGFGFPPLEAMAGRTAAVVSDAGSLPEVVGDAAVLVDPNDPLAWARALDEVCGDDVLHGQLLTRGLERARAFTWDTAADLTLAAYRDVWT